MKPGEIIETLTSGDIPAGGMGGVGIILLVLALKVGRRTLKFIFVLAALGLFAGAVWWHLHKR